jgi:hypothetical protein
MPAKVRFLTTAMVFRTKRFDTGLKSGAVIRRFTNNDTLLESTRQGVNWTFQYHGAASGTVLADERLDGLSPMTG